ncbi:TetR/AcrR family transcriptional regulator [Nonomuraea soli]|uniref:AcrR family transcriptional regulator n=1 Tax=Nonomuraea soli TaxID=1032476 RepID=A0A7W0CGF0_9ACTN|nr:TetR/AcrR family transcriptional regulator [Nonomuraea soli]MBA2890728.1 AcrR family transcriptional regulator [Nonomuraea soli]
MTSMRADAVRNRDLVLATARRAMAEGDMSLQLNDLARRAGIGVGTVYRHFPTRRALLESLAEPAFTALLDDARVASLREDAWTGLRQILRTLLVQQLSDPAFTEVISTSPALDASPDTTSHREAFADLAQAVLERARQAGALRLDLTPDDLHHLVCGTAFALRLTPDPNACLDRYLQVLFDGIRTTA